MDIADFCERGRNATITTFAQALPMWFGAVAPVALNNFRFVQAITLLSRDAWNVPVH
jgi:hypothetical protein